MSMYDLVQLRSIPTDHEGLIPYDICLKREIRLNAFEERGIRVYGEMLLHVYGEPSFEFSCLVFSPLPCVLWFSFLHKSNFLCVPHLDSMSSLSHKEKCGILWSWIVRMGVISIMQ